MKWFAQERCARDRLNPVHINVTTVLGMYCDSLLGTG